MKGTQTFHVQISWENAEHDLMGYPSGNPRSSGLYVCGGDFEFVLL